MIGGGGPVAWLSCPLRLQHVTLLAQTLPKVGLLLLDRHLGTHHYAYDTSNNRTNSAPLWRVAGPRAVYGPLERTKRRTNKRTSKPTQSNLEDRAASAVTEISGVLFFVERRHTGVHSRASAGR